MMSFTLAQHLLTAQTEQVASESMTWAQTIVLSIIQGLTEFLPVSSSGHLRIFSQLLFEHDAGSSFTAVIQIGTEVAVILYFAQDIWKIAVGWCKGLLDKSKRSLEYRMGWMVIIGSIPVAVAGFVFKDFIRTEARNLWLTAFMLIGFSFVMIWAERVGTHSRNYDDLNYKDALSVGLAQILALIPGVSRSGATTSMGLFRGLERPVAAKFSFLLAIPAVFGSGIFSLSDVFSPQAGQAADPAMLIVGVLISFAVGYVAIAWLMKFVQNHSFAWFALWRIPMGLFIIILLLTGTLTP